MTENLQTSILDAGFARVQAVPWDTLGRGERDDRLTALMGEFFRRAKAWAAHLGTDQRHVFENLTRQVDPAIEIPAPMQHWLEELMESRRIPISRGRHYVIAGAHGYLCWCRLRDLGRVPDVKLPEPYEPLIQFLEQGGGIYVEHGEFMTIEPNGVGFNIKLRHTEPEGEGQQ